MKSETLNLYRDRLDRARREMATYMNGMSIDDPTFSRSSRVFEIGKDIADILYGDGIRPDTVELSNKLKSFEKSVKRLVGRLAEDADVQVEDLPIDMPDEVVAGQTVPDEAKVFRKDKTYAASLINQAQAHLMEAHQIFCSGHKALRHLPELKALEDMSKSLNLISRDISRLDL